MLGKIARTVRRFAHFVWVQEQESGAIMAGVPIDMDPAKTGDKYAPSPAVREVATEWTEVSEVHTVTRRRRRRRRRHPRNA